MSENVWRSSASPNDLLKALRPWTDHQRKLRLYVCAWYRYCWGMLNGPCRELVAVSEAYCDGLLSDTAFQAAKQRVVKKASEEREQSGNQGLAEVGSGLLEMLELKHLPGWEGDPPPKYFFNGTEEQRKENDRARSISVEYQLNLLRDFFGNRSEEVVVGAASFNQTVRAVASQSYAEQVLPNGHLKPSSLMEIANALEEAGCANPVLIDHCRGSHFHFRGCWALDLILGKECRAQGSDWR